MTVPRWNRARERGQVLPLSALFMFTLLGAGALVLDVARVYSLQRFERSVADAAALAGGQDLQITGTRNITAAQYTNARADALNLLNRELGGTSSPSCAGSTASNIVDCAIPGTAYLVSIKTNPSPSAMTVDPARAVQVTIRQPNVSLTFGRLMGQTTWNVGITSVAGIGFIGQYAVITLQPPNGTDTGNALGSLALSGTGTSLTISGGDIGSNRDALTSGGSTIVLDTGYRIDHFDPPTSWTTPPPGHKIPTLIPDPNYTIPPSTGAPGTFASAASVGVKDTAANCLGIVNAWLVPDTNGYKPFVPMTAGSPNMSKITCYKPGVYNFTLNDGNGDLSILEPGLYFFNRGVTLMSNLIGGYQPSSKGVALVFPRDQQFKNNNTGLVALNAGTKLGSAAGSEASAALDYAANPIQTNGTPNLNMTIMVQKDAACTVTQPYPNACDDVHNNTIKLNGGSSIYLAGVQYAPSDNAALAGGVAAAGYVGQIVSWTVAYSGGTTIKQRYPGAAQNGVLRLDTACAGPNTSCSP